MHTMHLLPGVSIQPNLELKTRPKQLLGSLPLVIVFPGLTDAVPKNKVTEIISSQTFAFTLLRIRLAGEMKEARLEGAEYTIHCRKH
jgi:hypothetical protein